MLSVMRREKENSFIAIHPYLFKLVLLLAFISVFSPSCYTLQKVNTRIDNIEARQVKTEEYVENTRKELEKIRKILADMEAKISAVDERTSKQSAASSDVEKLKLDLSQLERRLSLIEVKLSMLESRFEGKEKKEKDEKLGSNNKKLEEKEAKAKLDNAKELIVNGKIDDAINIINSLVSSGYDSYELRFTLGDALFRKGDYKGSVTEWMRIVNDEDKIGKDSDILPRTYLRLGQAFMRLGDTKNARLMLQAVILKFPNSPEAKTAKNILENIK